MTTQRQRSTEAAATTSSRATDSADKNAAHSATEADVLAGLAERARNVESRIARIGIPRQELARLAGIDRGTLGRALKADPRTLANGARTWVRIENELDRLEDEIGIGAQLPAPDTELVESTVEYKTSDGVARITMSGRADAVAEAIRKVLGEG